MAWKKSLDVNILILPSSIGYLSSRKCLDESRKRFFLVDEDKVLFGLVPLSILLLLLYFPGPLMYSLKIPFEIEFPDLVPQCCTYYLKF